MAVYVIAEFQWNVICINHVFYARVIFIFHLQLFFDFLSIWQRQISHEKTLFARVGEQDHAVTLKIGGLKLLLLCVLQLQSIVVARENYRKIDDVVTSIAWFFAWMLAEEHISSLTINYLRHILLLYSCFVSSLVVTSKSWIYVTCFLNFSLIYFPNKCLKDIWKFFWI